MKKTAKKLLSILCVLSLLLSCFVGLGANAAGLPAATDSDLICYYTDGELINSSHTAVEKSAASYYTYDSAATSFTRINGATLTSWNVATLFSKESYNDFILEFDMKFNPVTFDDTGKKTSPEGTAWIVFGDQELGGSINAGIESDGTEVIQLIDSFSAENEIHTGLLRRYFSGSPNGGWWQSNKVNDFDGDAFHHVKLTVLNGKINLYFDSVRMITDWALNPNYKGGYVGIGTSLADTVFSNISVSYEAPSEMFKDFTPYHATNTGFYLQNVTESDYSAWTYKGNGIAGCTNNSSGTAILYSNAEYNDFEITFDYTTTNSTFYLGFGAQEMGGTILTKGNLANPTPSMIQFCASGVCAYAPNSAGNDGWFGNNAGNLFTDDSSKAAVHTAKVTVLNKVATVWINNNKQGSINLQNYAGGHIFFAGVYANDAVSTPVITTPEMANDKFSEDWVAYESSTNYNAQFWQENLTAKENISDSFYLDTAGRLTPYNGSTVSFIYSKETYTDFEMDFEFTSANHVYVGIGASDLGIVPTKPIAEQSAFSMRLYNSGIMQCAPTSAAGGDGWPYNDNWRTDADTQNANSVHTAKIVVNNGKVAIYIDGHRLGSESHSYAAPNYKGGHVYIQITDNGESVSLPLIKDTDVNEMFKDYTAFEATSNYNAQFWPTGLTKQDKISNHLTYAKDDRIGPFNGSTQSVLYSNAKYTDFDMSFEFTSNNQLYVGIGASDLGVVPTKPISEQSPFVMRLYNSGIMQCAPTSAAGGDGWPYNDSWRTDADTQNADSVHTCRIVVSGGAVAIYIDGHRLGSESHTYSPLNYKGGHIFFILTDANETISLPVIKDIGMTEEFTEAFTPYHSTTFTQVTVGEGEEATVKTSPYWANNLTKTDSLNDDWYIDEDGMMHKNGKVRMSTAYLPDIYGQNIRLTFNYKVSATTGNSGLFVGFGSQEMGEDWWQGQDSITSNIARIHAGNPVGYAPMSSGTGDTWIMGGMDSIFKEGWDSSIIHEAVFEIKYNTVYAWLDGIYRGSAELVNFEDGYIFFAAERSDVAFSMPVIEEITLPKYGDENSEAYGKKALFIGDSIGDGAGDKGGWHYRLGHHFDMQVTNNSAGGWILSDDDATGLGSIQDQLTSAIGEDYDYIIVEGGINDIMRHVNTSRDQCKMGEITTSYNSEDFDKTTMAGALENIFYNATTKFGGNTTVGFIMVYKPTQNWIGDWDTAEEYVDTILSICEKWGVSVFNMWDDDELTATLRESNTLLTDGLHFAHDGYEYVDKAMADWFDTLTTTEYAGYGHVNNDGVINILDLVRMKKLQSASTVEYLIAADVTKDGIFDTNDLVDMRKFLIGSKQGF